jgi:hypothetical protein
VVPPKDGFAHNSLVDIMSWDIIQIIDLKFVIDNCKDVIV